MGELDLVVLFLSTQGLLVLGLSSVYKTVREEAEHQKGEASQAPELPQVILEHFRSIFGQRDMAYVVLIISILAGVAWVANVVVILGQPVPVWAFSLALIEAIVLFFAIEALYLLSSKWVPAVLARNTVFVRAVDVAAFGGAIIFSLSSAVGCMYGVDISCSAFGWLGDLVFASFFVVFFVSGVGGMAIVDTICDTFSSHVPLGKKTHFPYLAVLIGSVAGLSIFLSSRGPVFGPGTGYVFLGATLATGFGAAYLVYLALRKTESEHFSTLVYGVLMLGLSGLFFDYSIGNLVPPSLNSSGVSPQSLAELALPLTFFGIGYLSLVFQIPRSLERKLGIKEDRLVASLTFLMVFTVVANYQRALFSGLGTVVFFFQREVPAALGLWAGALFFAIRKIKWTRERGRIKPGSTVPFCLDCEQRLEPTSKYCWKCGSSNLSTSEKTLFVGDAKPVQDLKEHHSTRRKIASIIAGGPLGFLTFGIDVRHKPGKEGQIVISDKAVYFAGNAYPLGRLTGVKTGHYSNSIVLSVKENITGPLKSPSSSHESSPISEIELKTSNPVALSRAIKQTLQHA